MSRKQDWVSKAIRKTDTPSNIKRKATRWANSQFDRHGNLVVWFDIWLAYVAGARSW